MKLENHIWISENGAPVLGNGRYQLLVQISKSGSLSKAAKEMNISYKKAWKLVDSMNSNASELLVETSRGGKSGGGTQITAYGFELMKKFEKARDLNLKMLSEMNMDLFNND